MGCSSGCGCEPQILVTQARGCTTITIDGQTHSWCDGSVVTCVQPADGSTVLTIDGVPCVIPAGTSVECATNGIIINGTLCAFPVTAVTGTGGVTVSNPATNTFVAQLEPIGAVAAICASAPAKAALLDCVISDDAGNAAVLGTDGGLVVAAHPTPLQHVTDICSTPAAKTALIDCVLSNDAGNIAVVGADGGIRVPAPVAFVHPTPLQHVTDICSTPAAKTALIDCVLSNDAGNIAVVGADGGIRVPATVLINDSTTALADVAALTATSRGLSLGEVNIPENRALTAAELAQANADRVSVALRYENAIYTNRAAERGSEGMRNVDGSMGHYSDPYQVIGGGGNGSNIVTNESNGGWVNISEGAGVVTATLDAPQYTGQLLTIDKSTFAFLSNDNMLGTLITANPDVAIPTSFIGTFRTSNLVGKNRQQGPSLFLRNGEAVTLIGQRGSTSGLFWRVIHDTTHYLSDVDYREETDGTYTMWGTAATVNVVLPLPALNTTYSAPNSTAKTLTGFTLAAPGDWIATGIIRA